MALASIGRMDGLRLRPLQRCLCWRTIALVTLPLSACAASTQVEVESPATERSSFAAQAGGISLGATIAGVGAGMALGLDGNPTAGRIVAAWSLAILPSVGRTIGGDMSGAGAFIGSRLAILGGGSLLITASHRNLAANLLESLLTGTAMSIVGIVDISGTPAALRRHRLDIAPAPVGDGHAPGVAIIGSFQ
jgi:hypothetical protein